MSELSDSLLPVKAKDAFFGCIQKMSDFFVNSDSSFQFTKYYKTNWKAMLECCKP